MRQRFSTARFGIPSVGTALAGAIASLGMAGMSAMAMQSISFQDLTNLSVCVGQSVNCNRHYIDRDSTGLGPYDEIQYQVSDRPELAEDEIEIGFRSIMDWAKEVRIVHATGQQIVMMEAEDKDSRLRRATLKASDLEGAKLVFVKGRMFGVRRPMYEMPLTQDTLEKLSGRRVTFTWVRD